MDYFASFSWTFWLILIPLGLLLLFYIFVDHRIKVLERNDTIDFADKFDSEERKALNEKAFIRKRRARSINGKINAVIVAVLLSLFYYYSLTATFMQNDIQLKTTKDLFLNPDIPNIAMGQFGYTMYAFVDIKAVLVPHQEEEETEFDETFEKEEQVVSDYTRYLDDTIWEKVIKDEGKKNYKK